MINGPKRQKPRQVKFYCTEEQFQELQALKIAWNSSLQDLMTEAVDGLIQAYEADERATLKVERTPWVQDLIESELFTPPSERIEISIKKSEHPMVQLWINCLRQLPDATVYAFGQLMQDTHAYFVKTGLKPRKYGKEVTDVPEAR